MRKQSVTKALAAVIAFLLVCTSVLAVPMKAEAATTKPTKITLAENKKTMYIGEKYTLKVKSTKPEKASKSVSFKSSNTKIATVNGKGRIVAKKKGSATITVTSKVNKKVKATCRIKVVQPVKTIAVTNAVNNTVAVRMGKSLTLKTSVSPSNAGNKKLTYSSSNKKIVTVNSKGKITAKKKAGTAKITIKAAVGKAKTTITVKVPAAKKVVTGITVSPTAKTVDEGETFGLTSTVKPKNAAVKLVSYQSGNTNIATVDGKGRVTAKKAGTTTITVTTLDGSKKAVCKVTVNAKVVPITGITLSQTSGTLEIGKTLALTAAVAPSNATNKNISWTSNNTGVADVSSIGVVTAKAAGTATVTATAQDGSGKSASCTITVKAAEPVGPTEVAITGVTLDKTSLSMYANAAGERLTAAVEPTNTTMNKAVAYISDNTQIKVNADGIIVPAITDKDATTVEAEITATTVNGKTAKCHVTVIVNADAKEDDEEKYIITLDKKAESYDITRNNEGNSQTSATTASVPLTAVEDDMNQFASVQWNNSTLKEKWNSEVVKKAMGLAVAQELLLSERVEVVVTSDNTMEVTAKGKAAVITRIDDEEKATSSLQIEISGKTVYLNDITVTEEEGAYFIAMAAQSGNTNLQLQVEIRKNATFMAVRQIYTDGESGLIAGVTSDENAYRIEIVKNMYKNLLDMVSISDPIRTMTVQNCYVK